jgi:hypothetical protein
MRLSDYLTRGAITAVAGGLLLVHREFTPLPKDNVTLVLLLFAALPWLGSVFKSVKIPNLIEIELQELREKVAESKGTAESAIRVATFAASATEPRALAAERSVTAPAQTGAEQHLAELIKKYNDIRREQKSGSLRTENMTRVVREMTELVPSLPSFDLSKLLFSDDNGTRLAAYAFLYEMPSSGDLRSLAESLAKHESTPFGQYWALKAFKRVLNNNGRQSIPPDVVAMLRSYRAQVQPGTDRDYELRQIFQYLGV